ncbi:MAG: 30S ribosomal protein S4e [Candidatus Aenigmarchaeota archaeon]|nr:30S ribosomal protein S4e [Candidatus Aenigmarchaeota archaeon]
MSLKRYAMPTFWPLERKTKKYAVKPLPGPHNSKTCMPIGIFLRDAMKFADTMKEAKDIVNRSLVKVDGVARRDVKFPVGVMDIITVGKESYLALPKKNGMRFLKSPAAAKLAKIKNKTVLKKGRMQLNLYNGRNIIAETGDYSTGDTLMIDVQSGAIKGVLKMKVGSQGLITEGKNVGTAGKIKKIVSTTGSEAEIIVLESEGTDVVVPKDYVFVIGEDSPVINVAEARGE